MYNLTPRTRQVRAADVRPGHIVVESHERPAVVVRVSYPRSGVRITLHCRYVWSATADPLRPMSDLDPDTLVHISKEK